MNEFPQIRNYLPLENFVADVVRICQVNVKNMVKSSERDRQANEGQKIRDQGSLLEPFSSEKIYNVLDLLLKIE